MRLRLIILFLLCGVLCASAQSFRESGDTRAVRKEAKTTPPRPLRPASPRLPDTVYSMETSKQHGWFGPLAVISPEIARHRPVNVRFTARDAKGHWHRMEMVDGRGQYVPGIINPYILNIGSAGSDSLANKDWVDRVGAACIYEFISDPSGDAVVQERAYDKDRNLIYIFSRTPIGRNKEGRRQYVGSYRDFYGLPAEMRLDSVYTYGTLVMLTEDRWGNDSVVEYMDARGVKKPNADGVAMAVYVNSPEGYRLRGESRDADGRLTLDNWGNCGTEIAWQDGLQISSRYMDDKWQPMRMPGIRETDNAGAAGAVNKYDGYGRRISMRYIDTDGSNMATDDGIARVDFKYNDYGEEIGRAFYGLDGKLHDSTHGFARSVVEYDDRGRILSTDWYNAAGLPNQDNRFLSRREQAFDSVGNTVIDRRYEGHGAKHVLIYEAIKKPRCHAYSYSDSSTRIDSLDAQGRPTLTAFYDSIGRPENVDGWAREVTTYTDGDRKNRATVEYFDEHMRPTNDENGRARIIYITDSVAAKQLRVGYRADGSLLDVYAFTFDSLPLYSVGGEYDTNMFGVPCRAGGTASVRHYYAKVLKTQRGQFATLVGRDEFDEPDYISSPWTLYYYQRLNPRLSSQFYDEDNRPIADIVALRDALPKVMSIEVVDSAAYRLGLRDNDIIVADGNYRNRPTDSVALDTFKRDWVLGLMSHGMAPRRMVVLRADTALGIYRPVVIDRLRGLPSQNGYIAHVRYLTHRQKDRINEIIDRVTAPGGPLLITGALPSGSYNDRMGAQHSDTPVKYRGITQKEELLFLTGGRGYLFDETSFRPTGNVGGDTIVLTMPDMYMVDRNKAYPREITDPAVLLSLSVPDLGLRWDAGDAVGGVATLLESRQAPGTYYPAVEYRVTRDGINVDSLSTHDQLVGVRVFSTVVPDSVVAALAPVVALARRETDAAMASARCDLRGRYVYEADSVWGVPVRLELTFDKKGDVTVRGTAPVGIEENGQGIVLRADIDYKGRLNGRSLPLADLATYECVRLINFPAADEAEVLPQLTEAFSTPDGRAALLKQLQWLSYGMGNIIYVHDHTSAGKPGTVNNKGQILELTHIN